MKINLRILLIFICFLINLFLIQDVYSESYIKITSVVGQKTPEVPLADVSMPDIVLDSSLIGDIDIDVSTIDIPDGTKVRIKFKDEENENPPEGITNSGMVTIPINLKRGDLKVIYAEVEAIPQAITFTPQYIPGLILWLKTDSLDLIDGDTIGKWSDSSGNKNDVIQNDINNKPVFKANVINNKPVVRFDGINDYLEASSAVTDLSQKLTAYLVAKIRSNPTSTQVIWGTQPSYSANGDSIYFTTKPNITWGEPAYSVTAGQTGVFGYYTVIVTATATDKGIVSWRVNGIESASSPGGRATSHTGNLTIGARVDNQKFFDGDIAEILIYSGEHTKEQVSSIENYLKNKYGL